MVTPPAQPQVNIFSDSQQQTHFAEICNALYERELITLAHQPISNISLLQRKLGGLRHHVKRAAYHFIHHTGPLSVDVHNASWQAKQSATCMGRRHDKDKTHQWFVQYARSGLPVVIYVKNINGEHLELDSIDRRVSSNIRDHAALGKYVLLRPSNAIFSAACCGHTWNHKGRSHPRTLTLRELLLSGSINWKNFR